MWEYFMRVTTHRNQKNNYECNKEQNVRMQLWTEGRREIIKTFLV